VTAVFLGSGRFFALSAQNRTGLTGCTKAHFFSHCTAVHVCIVFNGMLIEDLYWFLSYLPIIFVNDSSYLHFLFLFLLLHIHILIFSILIP
jgi:hypothetical protein